LGYRQEQWCSSHGDAQHRYAIDAPQCLAKIFDLLIGIAAEDLLRSRFVSGLAWVTSLIARYTRPSVCSKAAKQMIFT
jgi:hypothetical protein